MKSFTIGCEGCGGTTKVKAADAEALSAWFNLQKKNKKAILCKACRRK